MEIELWEIKLFNSTVRAKLNYANSTLTQACMTNVHVIVILRSVTFVAAGPSLGIDHSGHKFIWIDETR